MSFLKHPSYFEKDILGKGRSGKVTFWESDTLGKVYSVKGKILGTGW